MCGGFCKDLDFASSHLRRAMIVGAEYEVEPPMSRRAAEHSLEWRGGLDTYHESEGIGKSCCQRANYGAGCPHFEHPAAKHGVPPPLETLAEESRRLVQVNAQKKAGLVDFFRKNVHNKYNSVLHKKINVLHPTRTHQVHPVRLKTYQFLAISK